MDTKTFGIIGGVALIIALLSPLLLVRPIDVQKHYDKAEKLFESYKYEEAIKKYEKAIKVSKKPGAQSYKIDKDFPALANYKIALCYERLGEKSEFNRTKYYPKALNHILRTNAATDVYEHKMNLTFLHARILHKDKKPLEAEAKYTYFVQAYPNSPLVEEALYQIGIIYSNPLNFDFDKVYKSLNKLNNLFPNTRYREEAEYRLQQIEEKLYQIGIENYRSYILNSIPLNYDKAYESFNQLIDWYPTTQYREEAEYRLQQLFVNREIPEPPEPISEYEQQLIAAKELMKKESYYDAYLLLKSITDETTDRQLLYQSYEIMGDLYFEVENYLNALKNYEKALQYTDTEIQRQGLDGKILDTNIKPDRKDEKEGPDSELSHFTKAILLREEGRFLEAAEKFAALSNSELTPEDKVYAIYWSGYCYYKAGISDYNHYYESIRFFERLIKEYEGSTFIEQTDLINAYLYLVESYSDIPDNIGEPKERYEQIIKRIETVQSSYSEEVYRDELQEFSKIKSRTLAKLPYNEDDVPTPEPPEEELLVLQGRKHYNNGDLEKAYMSTQEALELEEELQSALLLLSEIHDKYFDRGESYLDQDRFDDAITQFMVCIDIDKGNKNAYLNIGLAYIYKEEFERVIQPLKNVLDLDNQHKKAYYNLAYTYYRLELLNYALNYVNKAIEVDHTYQNAQILREAIEEQLNN